MAIVPYIKINEHEVYYNDSGSGEAVIFLHNGFYSTTTWDGVRAQFAADYRVIDYDRAGYGRSSNLDSLEGDMVETGVAELEALVSHLGLERFHLVGHCIGGAIAFLYTVNHPEQVIKLVAEAVGYYGDDRSLLKTDMTFIPFDEIDGGLRSTLKEMHGEGYARKFWENISAHNESYIMSADYDIRGRIKKVKCPTLIISGDRDFYFEAEIATSIYKKLRRTARLWILPNTGHDVHLEQPEDFIKQVLTFLRE